MPNSLSMNSLQFWADFTPWCTCPFFIICMASMPRTIEVAVSYDLNPGMERTLFLMKR